MPTDVHDRSAGMHDAHTGRASAQCKWRCDAAFGMHELTPLESEHSGARVADQAQMLAEA